MSNLDNLFSDKTRVDAFPDLNKKSKNVSILRGGEIVSCSDYFHQHRDYNAAKLFDLNKRTFWHCQIKGGKYLGKSNEDISFDQNPYKQVATYKSVYVGGKSSDKDSSSMQFFSTNVENIGNINGSWAQISYKKPIMPTSMFIQVRPKYDYLQQYEVPKKISIVASKDDANIPDDKKRFTLLYRKDEGFGYKYARKIVFSFKSMLNKPYVDLKGNVKYENFSLFLNGKLYSTYLCSDRVQRVEIYIGGIDTMKVLFNNKKNFPDNTNPGILFTEFTVDGKNIIDFFVHETGDSRMNPKDGAFIYPEGYDLESAFPGNAKSNWAQPIPINMEDFELASTGEYYKTYRLIVEELYGGTKFNLSYWGITGDREKIEGFMNNNIISNNIFNSVYTNTPKIKGVNLLEGYRSNNNGKFNVLEPFTSDTNRAMSKEQELTNEINLFNEEYAKYIKCNGTHIEDSVRESGSPPLCNPETDYYRKIKKIEISLTIASNTTFPGGNSWKSFSFFGIPDGKTVSEQIGIPFTFTDGQVYTKGETPPSIILSNEPGAQSLNGLDAFAGKLDGMSFSFGSSSLQFYEFIVNITDNRGVTQNFISKKADRLGDSIEEFKNNHSQIVLLSATNNLNYYNQGIGNLTTRYDTIMNLIQDIINIQPTLNDAINLDQYNTNHNTLKENIKQFNEIRDDLDMKLRELYMIEGSTSATKKLQYDGTMFSGILWTVLATSVLYYTLYELD